MNRRYSELRSIPTFEERFEYLKMGCLVGDSTFGFDRFLNQALYASPEWKSIRRKIILRDDGCDLGISDRVIGGKVIVHHMNPITEDQINSRDPKIFDPEYLICVSSNTHNAIHFGDDSLLLKDYKPRSPGDTCPWR